MFTVYKHTSPSGKIYIGITSTSVKKRWANGNGYKTQPLMKKAIEKYGWDNFTHEIIATNIDRETAYEMEKYFISKFKSNEKEFGYNISAGGEKTALGLKRTQEQIQKMRERALGHHHTEETRKKISLANSGKNNFMYGKKHSNETKLKISKANKGSKGYWLGKKRDANTIRATIERSRKPIVCLETQQYFYSCKDAMNKYNIKCKTSMSNCLNGRSKTSGGYHWRYASKEEIYKNENH